MKSIAIETTWFLVLILISIIIAISIIFPLRDRIVKFFYCNIYSKLFPNENMEFCKEEKNIAEKVYIDGNELSAIIDFSNLIISCWENVEKYKIRENIICYEVVLRNVPDDLIILTENVSEAFKELYNCQIVQMKSYNCGYRDDVIWQGEVRKDKIVLISYDAEKDIIKIIST
ncbi:MAG: hypothetical protein QXQ14_00440 [Candidatus Aenigmatarchaeota archaeon]